MKLEDFRNLVRAEFGEDLKNATPANVREFLDRMQQEVFKTKITERIVLNEPATSYEEVIKDFFIRILDAPKDEAIMTLWSLAFDLSFAAIEYQYAERFANLFHELDDV